MSLRLVGKYNPQCNVEIQSEARESAPIASCRLWRAVRLVELAGIEPATS